MLLRVLFVEDTEDDAVLLTAQLQRDGYQVESARVQTADAMQAALREGSWDVIIADYRLPRFNAPQALALLRASDHDLPFIIVSGAVTEEEAIASLRAGAHDFISKGKLARLAPAIERERRDAATRRQRQADRARMQAQESSFRLLFESNPLPMWVYDIETLGFLEVNEAASEYYGYSRDEFLAMTIHDIRPTAQQARLAVQRLDQLPPRKRSGIWQHRTKGGTLIDVEIISHDLVFAGRAARLVVVNDITEREQAEAARRASENRTRLIIDTALDAVVTIDAQGLVTGWNAQAETIFGWPASEVMGCRLEELIVPPAHRSAHVQGMAHLRATGEGPVLGKRIEITALRRSGQEFPVELAITPLQTPDGTTFSAFVRDISERKQSEQALVEAAEALRTSEAELRALFAAMTDVILVMDREGRHLKVAPTNPRHLYAPSSELLGKTVHEIFPAAQADHLVERIQTALAARTPVNVEYSLAIRDQTIWFDATISPMSADTVFFVARNITDRLAAQRALVESEERYRVFFEASPVALWQEDFSDLKRRLAELRRQGVVDLPAYFDEHPDFVAECAQHIRIIDLNQSAMDMYRVASKDALLSALPQILSSEALSVLRAELLAIDAGASEYQTEAVNHTLDGDLIYINLHWTAVPGYEDSLARVIVSTLDLTDRRRAEAARAQSESLFRALFELSPDAVVLVDPHAATLDWPVVDCNVAACVMNGYTRDELVGQSVDLLNVDGATPASRGDYMRQLRAAAPLKFETLHRRKDGTVFPVEVSTNLIWIDGRELIIGIDRDITERKRAEAALQEAQAKYRVLIEQIPAITYVAAVDENSSTLYMSPQIEELGYTAAEHIADPRLWAQMMHPDDRVRVLDALQAKHPADRPLRSEYRVRARDGREVWLRDESVLVRDSAGQALVVQGVIFDVTDRKQSELQIQRQLERLASLRAIELAITSSLDLRLTLGIFLDQVIAQLGVHAADILMTDAADQALVFGAGRGFRTSNFQTARVRRGEGRAGRAALERSIVIETNAAPGIRRSPRTGMLGREAFVSYFGVPLISKGQVLGVLELFHREALHPDPEWLEFLEALAGQAAIAIDNTALFNRLQRTNAELRAAYDATIEGWSAALDLRDKETEGHSRRVTDLTLRLAEAVGMAASELAHVRHGALLHDIGKMGIPDRILLKPETLTADEWTVMRQHPTFAHSLLAPIAFLQHALDIPYCHHEKWDGTGYPRGLRGEEIPLAARLFAVVDVWDALSSNRPYRAAWSAERVLTHIRSLAGTHLDPRAVEVFMRVIATQLQPGER